MVVAQGKTISHLRIESKELEQVIMMDGSMVRPVLYFPGTKTGVWNGTIPARGRPSVNEIDDVNRLPRK